MLVLWVCAVCFLSVLMQCHLKKLWVRLALCHPPERLRRPGDSFFNVQGRKAVLKEKPSSL